MSYAAGFHMIRPTIALNSDYCKNMETSRASFQNSLRGETVPKRKYGSAALVLTKGSQFRVLCIGSLQATPVITDTFGTVLRKVRDSEIYQQQ